MMKILTTFIPASEGTAVVNDFDVKHQVKEVQRSIGYLPEHNPLYLELYVKEYLQFNADLFKIGKSRIQEVINQTGLTPEAHKKSDNFLKAIGNALVWLLPCCTILMF